MTELRLVSWSCTDWERHRYRIHQLVSQPTYSSSKRGYKGWQRFVRVSLSYRRHLFSDTVGLQSLSMITVTNTRIVAMNSTGTISRKAILNFLQKSRAAARFPPRTAPPPVESKTREIIRSWKLDIPEHLYEKYIVAGIDIGFAAYQHTTHELQIAVSLFTFCATIIDDVALVDTQSLREFIPRLCTGRPQLRPILDHFVQTTVALREFFPEYPANALYSAVLSYVNEEVYCGNEAKELVLSPEAGQYVEYSRFKGGVPEPYALSVWPKDICPDVSEYIQAVPWVFQFPYMEWFYWSIFVRDSIVFINGLKYVLKWFCDTATSNHLSSTLVTCSLSIRKLSRVTKITTLTNTPEFTGDPWKSQSTTWVRS